MGYRARDVLLKFFVTEEERTHIYHKMSLMKTKNLSAYLRKMAIDGYLLFVDYSMFNDICAELSGISRSINQIAKRVNSTDTIYGEDISDIKARQEEIWRLVNTVLNKLP